MRLVFLPTGWTIALDIVAWLVIHLGVVALMVSVPSQRFAPERGLFRPRRWERDGRLYESLFRVRRWKDWLPDGADVMRWRSFRKKRLAQRDTAYLARFAAETCRAELTHVIHMSFAPLFFLWNPAWVGGVMIAYAMAENVPLILAQRYTRARLLRVLRGRRAARHLSAAA